MPVNRPFSVTLLLLMVLSLSAWGAVRLISALRWWDVMVEFGASLSPWYLSITGAGWVAAGGVLLLGMVNRRRWSHPAVVSLMVVWLLEYWIERIFFQSPRANLPFALTLSILCMVITWVLAILPGTRSYFTKSEEHEQPVEKPDPA